MMQQRGKLPHHAFKTCAISVALSAGALFSGASQAIDVDAGDYTALPAGTNLAILYAQHAQRKSAYADGDEQPGNIRLDSTVGIARGVHFMEIGGIVVDPQFLLPFGKLEAKDDLSALGNASGLGDLILAATAWFVNDPKANRYFGVTPFLFVPIGSYDHNDALNLGENRWKFTLQAGYITGLSPTVSLDLVGDVTLYGKNDEFGPAKASLEQQPSFQVQTHLRYHLSKAWDLRAGLSHAWGGETEVDGVDSGDELGTTKMQVGTAWFAAPTVQVLATYGRDLSVENGLKEDNRLNLRLLKLF